MARDTPARAATSAMVGGFLVSFGCDNSFSLLRRNAPYGTRAWFLLLSGTTPPAAAPGGVGPHNTAARRDWWGEMTVCFDIGGSTIKAAQALTPANLVPLGPRDTPADDFGAFCRALAGSPNRRANGDTALDRHLRCVDPQTGRIKCANIPCIDGRRLSTDLECRARSSRAGDQRRRLFCRRRGRALAPGAATVSCFGIILGTGVGGGVVVNGRLVEGAGGFAGEWGHGAILARQAGNPPVDIPWFRAAAD